MAETVRDAFEEWAHADHRRLEPNEYEADDRTPGNNHYYDADTTNQAYIGWCAAWNRRDGTAELVEALRLAVQRLNESGTGEMGLIDTIHETDSILRSALAKHGGGT